MNSPYVTYNQYKPMTDEETLLLGRECLIDQLRIAERCLREAREQLSFERE